MNVDLSQMIKATEELDQLIAAAEGKIDFSLESTTSYSDFFGRLGDAIRNTFKVIFNEHTTAEMLSPLHPGNLPVLIESRGINAVRSTVVYRLPKQTGSMRELTLLLKSQLDTLADIEKRLYDPVYKWSGRVVNDSEFAERIWIDRNVKFVDTEAMIEDVAKLFKPVARTNSDSEFIEFIAMYPTTVEFSKTHGLLLELQESLGRIDLVDIQKIEKKIIENINKLIRMSNDPDEEFVMPQETKVMLAKTFRAIAFETEYLVAAAFQANQVIGAWNATVEKLKNDYDS